MTVEEPEDDDAELDVFRPAGRHTSFTRRSKPRAELSPVPDAALVRLEDLLLFKDPPAPGSPEPKQKTTAAARGRWQLPHYLRAVAVTAAATVPLALTVTVVLDTAQIRDSADHALPAYAESSAATPRPNLATADTTTPPPTDRPITNPVATNIPSAELEPAGHTSPTAAGPATTTSAPSSSPSPKPSKTTKAPDSDSEAAARSLQSVNYPDRYVRQRDGLGYLDAVRDKRAEFTMVAGLADAHCYSFVTGDGRYLWDSDSRIRVSASNGSAEFRKDATFCKRSGWAYDSVSFESYNYPGSFLRHRDFKLYVEGYEHTALFHADSSFRIVNP